MKKLQNLKVALVYDRVNKWGGAERTLLVLHEIFPNAPIYTSVYDQNSAKWAKVFPKVIPSFLQSIPFARKKHELLSIFTPVAFESFRFSEYDLVISVTSESAKGILTKPETLHICYCLTPIRYLYSGYEDYFENPPSDFNFIPFFGLASKLPIAYMRRWDNVAKDRPDKYIAISNIVSERIKKYYRRDSEIIFPPNDIAKFSNGAGKSKKENYYLYVSRLVPYKKADLAIRAFNRLGKRLIVVGDGSEMKKLKDIAKKNIVFKGKVKEDVLVKLYQKARGLIFPQNEDFGMVVVEAQAAGTAVVALKKGGAMDTVVEGETGVFFEKQTEKELIRAVRRFEQIDFNKKALLKNVKRFSKEKFKKDFQRTVQKYLS